MTSTPTPERPALTPMESSMFSGHHYDPNTRKLTVQFKGRGDAPGKLWEYDDVPAEKAEAFAGSASAGRYFNEKLKGNHEGREII